MLQEVQKYFFKSHKSTIKTMISNVYHKNKIPIWRTTNRFKFSLNLPDLILDVNNKMDIKHVTDLNHFYLGYETHWQPVKTCSPLMSQAGWPRFQNKDLINTQKNFFSIQSTFYLGFAHFQYFQKLIYQKRHTKKKTNYLKA